MIIVIMVVINQPAPDIMPKADPFIKCVYPNICYHTHHLNKLQIIALKFIEKEAGKIILIFHSLFDSFITAKHQCVFSVFQ